MLTARWSRRAMDIRGVYSRAGDPAASRSGECAAVPLSKTSVETVSRGLQRLGAVTHLDERVLSATCGWTGRARRGGRFPSRRLYLLAGLLLLGDDLRGDFCVGRCGDDLLGLEIGLHLVRSARDDLVCEGV